MLIIKNACLPRRYTKSVDMWAMGCILGEMLVGKPLFPGKSTLHQIETIMEFTGRPKCVDASPRWCHVFF